MEKTSYKEKYLETLKMLRALQLSISPYWDGIKDSADLFYQYSLSDLEYFWYECLDREYDSLYPGIEGYCA